MGKIYVFQKSRKIKPTFKRTFVKSIKVLSNPLRNFTKTNIKDVKPTYKLKQWTQYFDIILMMLLSFTVMLIICIYILVCIIFFK